MEEKFAGGKFREIPFAMDVIFAGGKFRAKSKFAKIAKIYSTRKIGVIQYPVSAVANRASHQNHRPHITVGKDAAEEEAEGKDAAEEEAEGKDAEEEEAV